MKVFSSQSFFKIAGSAPTVLQEDLLDKFYILGYVYFIYLSVIKAFIKPKGSVAGAMPSNPASASGIPSQPAYPPPGYTPTMPQADTDSPIVKC